MLTGIIALMKTALYLDGAQSTAMVTPTVLLTVMMSSLTIKNSVPAR